MVVHPSILHFQAFILLRDFFLFLNRINHSPGWGRCCWHILSSVTHFSSHLCVQIELSIMLGTDRLFINTSLSPLWSAAISKKIPLSKFECLCNAAKELFSSPISYWEDLPFRWPTAESNFYCSLLFDNSSALSFVWEDTIVIFRCNQSDCTLAQTEDMEDTAYQALEMAVLA